MARNSIKFGFIAFAFFLASCTSDLPEAPKYELCYIPGVSKPCMSLIEVGSKEKCQEFGGQISYQENCEDKR